MYVYVYMTGEVGILNLVVKHLSLILEGKFGGIVN